MTILPQEVALAIVIPIYQHSVLMVDAIKAGVREASNNQGAVILVNDGCPFAETHQICGILADANPDLLHYIRCPNGGLSSARNRGIRYARLLFPKLQNIFLLDADNRLSPGAMSRALSILRTTGADWVYPNIDKFGLEWSGDFTPAYSLFRHLFQNVCEAGSLVSIRVFNAGVYFDESMRRGYEDWEFWLHCASKGFRGVPFEDFGFQYRARRESMVRESDRDGSAILAYIHRKHARLFSWSHMLRLEHTEAPRFCVIDGGGRRVSFTSSAHSDGFAFQRADLDLHYWRSIAYPVRYHYPNFTVSLDRRVQAELERLRILDLVFWKVEDALSQTHFAFVLCAYDPVQIAIDTVSIDAAAGITILSCQVAATHRSCLHECILDKDTGWIESLRTNHPHPPFTILRISAPFLHFLTDGAEQWSALAALLAIFYQLRTSPWRESHRPWDWRSQADGLIPSCDLFQQTRRHMKAFAPVLGTGVDCRRQAVFILPMLSFGGVEQVASQIALQMRALGFSTRVIVASRNSVPEPDRLLPIYDSILFLDDPTSVAWSPTGQTYYGHSIQAWEDIGRLDRLIGLCSGCDVIFSFQAFQANAIVGWLKRHGVVTIASLHLFDKDDLNSPAGHPYLCLAYEHAYDYMTSCSQSLMRSLHSLGVPSDKLIHLPNAPTFLIEADALAQRKAAIEIRARSEPQSALRVICIGRLDRQKGVERVAAVIVAARRLGLDLEWSLLGDVVVEGNTKKMTELEGIPISRPVYGRSSLLGLLMLADVILVLSHWEGAPLTVIEAQSVGVVPIATDVGAVGELIDDGVDGLLVPNGSTGQVVNRVLTLLFRLSRDAEWRVKLAFGGMTRLRNRSWDESSHDLIRRIGALPRSAQMRADVNA